MNKLYALIPIALIILLTIIGIALAKGVVGPKKPQGLRIVYGSTNPSSVSGSDRYMTGYMIKRLERKRDGIKY